MVDLILRTVAVVVVAIELERAAAERVREPELAVTVPAIVLARDDVGVRQRVVPTDR